MRNTAQVCRRVCQMDLSDMFLLITLGLQVLWGKIIEVKRHSHHTPWHIKVTCYLPSAGPIKVDEMVLASFLCCKVTVSPFSYYDIWKEVTLCSSDLERVQLHFLKWSILSIIWNHLHGRFVCSPPLFLHSITNLQ